MDKLNISEGDWEIKLYGDQSKLRKIVSPNEDVCKISIQSSFDTTNLSKEEDNAKAIVTAVNNTYKKGIDPEAVPDMAEALQKCRKTLYELEREVSTRDIDRVDDSISQATKALKKAEL